MANLRRWSPRVLFAATVALTCIADGTPVRAQQPATPSKTQDLVQLINRERVNAGVLPLARSSELDAAAQAHSVDMVQHNYLDHTGSDGSEPQDRADKAGYHVPPQSGWIVVEVISAISADPRGPVDWWLNQSPEMHGKVLLNPRWREMGAGYAEGGEYGNYWTALFGCRPGVLPTLNLDGVTYSSREECGDPSVAAATLTPIAIVAAVPAAILASTPLPTLTPVGLKVSPEIPAAGSLVNVQWRGIPSASGTDWIGLYHAGDTDTAYIMWTYVGCALTPLDARTLGSCNLLLPASLAAGTYEFRLFADNGYHRLAVSSAFHIP